MQRIIRTKVSNLVIAGYNNLGSNGTIGEKVNNLKDTNNLSTGISIHVLSAFASAGGSASAWATSDYHGLAENFWEWAWGSPTNGVGVIQLRGFVPNTSVTLLLAGYSFNTRHTDFLVNGINAPRYLNTSALPPNAPVSIEAVSDSSGFVTITGNKVGSDWYFNGAVIIYDDKPIISGIDRLEMGLVSTATTNDSSFIATSVNIESNGVNKTVSATNLGNGSFSFIPPMWVDEETALLPGPQNITATNGTTTSEVIVGTLVIPSTLSSITLTSISNDSYGIKGGVSPVLEIGSIVIFNPTEGTVNNSGEWEDLIWDGAYWIASNILGTVNLWDRDPSDKIARLTPLDIIGDLIIIDLASCHKQDESPLYDGLYFNIDRP